jgi:hypothetical protein
MKNNPLQQLVTFGQSIWLDYIRRDLIKSGELKRLIVEEGLRGMTSNPSIFEKAIVESHVYADDIRDMATAGKDAKEIYEALSQRDVQSAADEFRPLYDSTDGKDGYVSLGAPAKPSFPGQQDFNVCISGESGSSDISDIQGSPRNVPLLARFKQTGL